MSPSRRELLASIPPATLAAGLLAGYPLTSFAAEPDEKKSSLWHGFPRQDAKLVREVVGASHGQESKVRELVTAKPALVNAAWDWSFGDWETPLGAASHVGNRSIAAFLLEKGARIDIFAAAMLGLTEVVKGFVTAQPGIQRTLGPHGITLLAHARVGGKPAADTLAYLESLGDAGQGIKTKPIDEERKKIYLGKFESSGAPGPFEVKQNKSGQLTLEINTGSTDYTPRFFMHHLGNDEFHPPAVPTVRIAFAVKDGQAMSFTIREREPILTANRVVG
jgi:hypothetical protein